MTLPAASAICVSGAVAPILAAAAMAAPQPRQRRRWAGVPAALLLAVLAGCVAPAPAVGTGPLPAGIMDQALLAEQQQEYVVVFKRGFDASKVRALCNADQSAAMGARRFQGLCRRRFSALLNGFAGAQVWVGRKCLPCVCCASYSSMPLRDQSTTVHTGACAWCRRFHRAPPLAGSKPPCRSLSMEQPVAPYP